MHASDNLILITLLVKLGVAAALASSLARSTRFKKLLLRHGLNLIAERVEDEKTVVQLLDYNVDFAQGYLFGEAMTPVAFAQWLEARERQPMKGVA